MAQIRNAKNVETKNNIARYLYDMDDIEVANFVGRLVNGVFVPSNTDYNKAVALSKNGKNVVMTSNSVGRVRSEEISVGSETYYAFNY